MLKNFAKYDCYCGWRFAPIIDFRMFQKYRHATMISNGGIVDGKAALKLQRRIQITISKAYCI